TGIEPYFRLIRFSQKDKDHLYESVLSELALNPFEVAIVDDRVIRGIRWGNKRGATTVWLKKGKFSHEEPSEDTGIPTYTIQNIEELCTISFSMQLLKEAETRNTTSARKSPHR
ncbi:HAD hydrolase-like protein, partial [Dictyobacter arantiisoli]|uniref:HAD hydrolase-like protein n=1 Tax=Dictyobacter arantiisoli TaxID=2014874 RepID=UPI0011EC1C29